MASVDGKDHIHHEGIVLGDITGHAPKILVKGHGGDTDSTAGTDMSGKAMGALTSLTSEMVGSGTNVKNESPTN